MNKNNQPSITLVWECGYTQTTDYDINEAGIKGRKYNNKRPVKAIVRGEVMEDVIASLKYVLHSNKGEIIYEWFTRENQSSNDSGGLSE